MLAVLGSATRTEERNLKLWVVPELWLSCANAVMARASMRGSFSRSELAHPSAIIPIAVARATGPFLRPNQRPGVKHKGPPRFFHHAGAESYPFNGLCVQH